MIAGAPGVASRRLLVGLCGLHVALARPGATCRHRRRWRLVLQLVPVRGARRASRLAAIPVCS